MEQDLFAGPTAKIGRARRHISDLEQSIRAFLQTGACTVHIEEESDGGHTLKVAAVRPLPEEIPLIIGDAANNLRSALDILISGFIANAGGNIATGSLPIREKREDLETALQGSEIGKVRPDIAQFILDRVKPYKDGTFPIWALSKLDNTNKHRLVIPIAAVTRLSGLSARDDNNNTFPNMTVTVDHGRIMNLIRTGARMHITNAGTPSIAVLFDKGQPFEGNAVLPTLEGVADVVSQTVESFRVFAP